MNISYLLIKMIGYNYSIPNLNLVDRVITMTILLEVNKFNCNDDHFRSQLCLHQNIEYFLCVQILIIIYCHKHVYYYEDIIDSYCNV